MGAGKGRLATFPRGRMTESSSCRRLTEAASKSGRARVPYPNGCTRSFLPVPTHSGDRSPGHAGRRLAAARSGTAGRQRLLQVPGASAAAAQGLRPLRWNGPRSPPALSAIPQPCASTRGVSLKKQAWRSRRVGV